MTYAEIFETETSAPVVAPSAPVVASEVPSDLACRAMLVGLTVTQWTARKVDKTATQKVHDDARAAADAGRYNKLLIAKESLAEITRAVSDARTFHYSRTLPWLDEGGRVLPAKLFGDYTQGLREIRERFEQAVKRFCGSYEVYVTDARSRLGDLFSEDDYPSVRSIRAKFSFRSVVLPLPTARDFRVQLSQGQADAVRAEILATTQDSLQRATKDAWTRIADVVGRMVDRLSTYEPSQGPGVRERNGFHGSLVTNIADLVDVLPAFNLTGDPALDAITERLREQLCQHPAEDLKADKTLRQDTAAAAAAILAEVEGYL